VEVVMTKEEEIKAIVDQISGLNYMSNIDNLLEKADINLDLKLEKPHHFEYCNRECPTIKTIFRLIAIRIYEHGLRANDLEELAWKANRPPTIFTRLRIKRRARDRRLEAVG